MLRNLNKIKKAKMADDGAICYRKYHNNAAIVFDRGNDVSIVCTRLVILNLKSLVLKNLQYKDKNILNQFICKNIFNQFICVSEVLDETCHSTGLYRLRIYDTCIEQWSDALAICEITVDEINDLNDAVHTAQKWLKEFTDKNFKELSDAEKLYLELGD